ncbi:MAG: Do family serine endopeptidase [Nitrospirota bacterium]|nr:Do family serine endopeptidase [Nitrospirota bacterium]
MLSLTLSMTFIQCSPTADETPPLAESRSLIPMPASTRDPMPIVQPVGLAFPANETFIKVSKKAMASVVNISSSRKAGNNQQGSPSPFFDDPFFRRFFGEEFGQRFRNPQPRQEPGLGSGVIVSANGYIITNNHVVEQADELTVLLGDKRKFPARLIGTDPKTDLAVIKIDAQDLPTLEWGNSGMLQVGELVLAVGNPFGLNQTVTMGIISAIGRANMGIVDYEDFIQTDAAINPGNSGGALVNLQGQLIGINTAIFSRTGGYMGIGFSIPSNMVKGVMVNLIDHGKVIRGWLGVSIQELTPALAEQFHAPDSQGALVGDVVDHSPAADAGLNRGDVIRRYQNHAVKDPTHLRSLVADTSPGSTISLEVLRDGATKAISVSIGELPKNLTAMRSSNRESPKNHALSGMAVEQVPHGRTKNNEGVMISSVNPDSAAQKAGLRKGDIIIEINRKPVRTIEDYSALTEKLGTKTPVLLLLKRGAGTIYLSIKP